MQSRLVRCIDCDEVIGLSEYDFSPEYQYDKDNDCFIEMYKNDREVFTDSHKDHNKEELRVHKTSFVSDRPYSEPLKACYFEATNGRENFVIKRWRDDIAHPVKYELFKGSIEIVDLSLEVQYRDIRKQFEVDMDCNISGDKIDYFITTVEKVIQRVDPRALLEDSLESDDPLVVYCRLSDTIVESIIEECKGIFSQEEVNNLGNFMRRNNDYGGVMAPLARFRYEIRYSHEGGGDFKENFIMKELVDRGESPYSVESF